MKDNTNSLILTDIEKANLFNSSFQNFFTHDNGAVFDYNLPKFHMEHFTILPGDILKACSKMKKKLSRTPEGIPSYFISKVIHSILYPLTIIFNLSLTLGAIPTQWKKAIVIPVYKKGNRHEVGNYRPVSLTSSFSRLFESVLLDKLMPFVLQHKLISPSQFGFLPGRSSCGQLLTCLHKWLSSFCKSNCTKVVYTDISKAFDSVNHRFLIAILNQFGFNEQVISWVKNFLSDRQQQVCINDAMSAPVAVLSGVPQGSVIGSFLFLLFINGVSDSEIHDKAYVSMYADDTKIFSIYQSDLQLSLNSMCECLSKHQLNLAHHKCAVIKIKKDSVVDNSQFFFDNYQINEQDSIRDLGIYISSNMTWTNHISHICSKASVKSYQILKSTKTKNIWTLVHLFTTYIRPLIEYNSPIWSPYLLKEINQIERIQRHYTKRAFQRCGIPFNGYKDRLVKVGLMSLQSRRVFLDLLFMYKLINNLIDINFRDFFVFKLNTYNLRSHSLQISPRLQFNSSLWHNSFFVRVPSIWNRLPVAVASANTLHSFKSLLKMHLLALP